MPSPRYTPIEVATWLRDAPRTVAALAAAFDNFDRDNPSPLFRMATRLRRDGQLTAALGEIAAGLAALGTLDEMPMLPRRVIRNKPAEPSQRTRRGRARPLPETIILRRLHKAGAFWQEVLARCQ